MQIYAKKHAQNMPLHRLQNVKDAEYMHKVCIIMHKVWRICMSLYYSIIMIVSIFCKYVHFSLC